jgi:hypothetical protein
MAFIKGLLTAYLRANSTDLGFYAARDKFYYKLRNRGYPASFIAPIFKEFGRYNSKKRDDLLTKKPSNQTEGTIPLTLKLQNNHSIDQLKIRDFLAKCRDRLHPILAKDEFILSLRRPKRLTQSLIKNTFTSQ